MRRLMSRANSFTNYPFPTGKSLKDWESEGRIPATLRQYSGFGGSEEWRKQGADLEKPGRTAWLGILYFQVTSISTCINQKGNQASTFILKIPAPDAPFR
jgi:hypothetical protein